MTKVLNGIGAIGVMVGFVGLVGSVGAYEVANISLMQAIGQMMIAGVVALAGTKLMKAGEQVD